MSSLLANQATLADLSNKFEGRIPVRIHFLDNSSKVFLVDGKIPIKDLLAQCVSKLGVAEAAVVLPYFGLFESKNGNSIDGVLAMDATVVSVIQSWQSAGVEKTAKFLFMLRLQVQSLWGLTPKDKVANDQGLADESELSNELYFHNAELIDPNVMHIQFIQAVFHVITGKYPTTPDEGLLLGAIHFIIKFGRYNADKHKVGFLGNRIVEFVPIKLLKSSLSGGKQADSLTTWEGHFLERVKALSEKCVEDPRYRNNRSSGNDGEDGEEEESNQFVLIKVEHRTITPERYYMEIIYAMAPIYGSTFFKTTQRNSKLPDTVNIGIHPDGIHLFDKSKKHLKFFSIQEILRWGFKPNTMFYFEVNPDSNEYNIGSFEFETIEGKVISDLMTDYAMAFLKERERQEERAKYFTPVVSGPKTVRTNTSAGNGKRMTKEQAAAKIQALYRGFSLRNEWIKEDSAILLQSIYRGYRARVLLSNMIEQMVRDGEL